MPQFKCDSCGKDFKNAIVTKVGKRNVCWRCYKKGEK